MYQRLTTIACLMIAIFTIGISQMKSADTTSAAQRIDAPPIQDAPDSTTLSTPQLIDQALARGEITKDERLLLLAYALYEPESLPSRYESQVGWYGTQYVRELIEAHTLLETAPTSPEQASEMDRILSTTAATICDVEDSANTTDSTYFRINYGTISGGLTIDNYKTSLDTTYQIEVTNYGWAPPPLAPANTFNKYPVQVSALGNSLFGYVTPSGGSFTAFVGNNPNTPETETAAFASCMVLNDDFSQFGAPGAQGNLDATTSHEYVHAIQFGYGDPDPSEDGMWYESVAAYMEDEIFDSANSAYQYLWPVVESCMGEWPDNGPPGGVSQYSNFLFFRHVSEHNGGTNSAGGGEDVAQQLWKNIGAGQAQLDAMNNALSVEGTDSNNLNDAFHKYAIAAKGSKACGAGYPAPYCFEEGAAHLASKSGTLIANHGTVAANPGSYTGSIRDHYAINFVGLPNSGTYKVSLQNTASGGELRGTVVCDTGSTYNITAFPAVASASQTTEIGSFNATGCSSVVAIITNQAKTAGNPATCTSHSYQLAVAAPSANTPTPTATSTDTPVAPTNTPTATPVAPTATSTNTPVAPTDTPTATPVAPSNTSTATPTATNTPAAPSNTPTATPTDTPVPPTGLAIYMSPSRTVRAGGIRIRDEDIALYDYFSQSWTMIFDGSDVGVGNTDIDGFHLWYGDDILMSFDRPINFPTLGWVDDSDIVRFTPTSLGNNTAGTWTLFFDGSAYELTRNNEDIDGVAMSPAGDLLISTTGTARVAGIKALDEDILKFSGGAVSAAGIMGGGGTWSLYFDGSDIRLSNSGSEDVNGISVNSSNGNLFLTTKGNFQAISLNLIEGDSDDIIGCEVPSVGATSPCIFAKLFDGDQTMWRKDIDGISILSEAPSMARISTQTQELEIERVQFEVADDESASDESAEDTELDEYDINQDGELNELFIPIVTR